MSFRLVDDFMQGVKSLFFRGNVPVGRCGLAGIGSLNDHKVSIVIIDSVHWKQNVGMSVWLSSQ